MKIGMYTEDEILEHLTKGEGRGFLGRSMYDAIFDKIHSLITENEQLKGNWTKLKEWLEEMINEIKTNDIYDRTEYECTQITTLENVLAKLEEIEGGMNI